MSLNWCKATDILSILWFVDQENYIIKEESILKRYHLKIFSCLSAFLKS
jgi:hypothetical protein